MASHAAIQRHSAAPMPAGKTWTPALAVLACGLLVLALLFRAEAGAAVKVWSESTAFGHCFLVAPIAAWLAWERRGALLGLTPRPAPWLALLAVPVAGVWLAAQRLGLMEGRQLAALCLVWLLTLSVTGLAVGRAMAVPLAYLIFLVPFGAFLVPALQDFTAAFIAVGLSVLDIPHVVTAILIEIPEGAFRVAEACAGLRFLIAAIAFGTLYACVIYHSAWRRAAFIAVCVAVPVLANGVRALGIVLLGHVKGSAAAGAVDHVLYGWMFFSAVILLLVLVGLPFREDSTPFAPPARPSPPVPPVRPGARAAASAAAALAVVVAASIGPAAAAWLAQRARLDAAALGGQAERLLAGLVMPAGCAADPAKPLSENLNRDSVNRGDARQIVCDGVALEVRVALFSPLAGPAVLAAWRDAADVGEAEDVEARRLDLPGASWRMMIARDPLRVAASALWLDGVPAPTGLALRRRLALDGLRTGGAGGRAKGGTGEPTMLATIAAKAAAEPAALAAVEAMARAPGMLPAPAP